LNEVRYSISDIFQYLQIFCFWTEVDPTEIIFINLFRYAFS
jgi:hypothetical protein